MTPRPCDLLEQMLWGSLTDKQLIEKLAERISTEDIRDIIFARRLFGEQPPYAGKYAAIMVHYGLIPRPKIIDQALRRAYRRKWPRTV